MAKAKKILDKMGANPQNDWKIKDVQTVCEYCNLECAPPSGGGSHWKVSSEHLEGILTIPSNRPIKAIYIKKLIGYISAHQDAEEDNGDG
ncbi:MAG: type II toxin-antitoxin system HicA family toxin [Alphaproteobacteria bacterium]|nr:type II toxin-antitoxin system HicA family toxin [Alphaproteobacteria bacterium]